RAVHVGDSDAVSVLFRGILRVSRKKTKSENSNKFKDEIKGFLGGSHLQRSKGLLGNAGPYSRREAKQEGSTTMKVRAEERAKTMGQFGRSIVYWFGVATAVQNRRQQPIRSEERRVGK